MLFPRPRRLRNTERERLADEKSLIATKTLAPQACSSQSSAIVVVGTAAPARLAAEMLKPSGPAEPARRFSAYRTD